jgi:hypothetical protein
LVPNQDCPIGVGGQRPATIAEFTLQTQATDFYDIMDINGANIGEQMGPLPTSTQTPGAVPTFYWCSTPGGGNCKFDYGTFTGHVPLAQPIDGMPLLLIAKGCTQGPTPAVGYPLGFQCDGTPALPMACASCNAPAARSVPSPSSASWLRTVILIANAASKAIARRVSFAAVSSVHSGGGHFQQQCGSFEGWWSADDFCGNPDNIIGNPSNPVLNCGATATDGDGGTQSLSVV